MKNLIFLIIVFVISSCSPPETETDVCIDNMIQMLEMEHYNGVIESECQDYLLWFIHEGSDYFMYDNPCADIALHLWDCEKVDICADNSNQCQTIMSNMTHQGVIGRDK